MPHDPQRLPLLLSLYHRRVGSRGGPAGNDCVPGWGLRGCHMKLLKSYIPRLDNCCAVQPAALKSKVARQLPEPITGLWSMTEDRSLSIFRHEGRGLHRLGAEMAGGGEVPREVFLVIDELSEAGRKHRQVA